MPVNYYLAIKALHIIAFTAWMAGLFYLPRLFVYHTRSAPGDPSDAMFQMMEAKLLRFIMGPAAIATWIFGLLLALDLFHGDWPPLWFYVKLLAVLLMTLFHTVCIRHHRGFKAGENEKTERYYRFFNEAPTVLLVIIVFSVIFQPDLG